jgi:hypothetical protein
MVVMGPGSSMHRRIWLGSFWLVKKTGVGGNIRAPKAWFEAMMPVHFFVARSRQRICPGSAGIKLALESLGIQRG